MSSCVLFHNPRCSKSRAALALLEERGVDFSVRRYLDDPPSTAELVSLLRKLGLDDAQDLMRKNEAVYKELGLKDANRETCLQALAGNPILIQRPILVCGDRAAIGRPPDAILEVL